MTPEAEREAEAATVWRQHGDRAPLVIAERIGQLAASKDWAGVDRWKQIAARLDAMLRATRQ